MSPGKPMSSSDSTTARPIDGRSEAPSTATDRGRRSASSRTAAPRPRHEGDDAAQRDEREQQRGDDRDDRVGLEANALEHLLRQRARLPPRDEERDDGLVEGVEEREER